MLALVIAVPLLGAAVLLGAGRLLPRRAADSLAALAAAATGVLAAAVLARTGGGRIVEWMGGWRPRGGQGVGIPLVADPLAAGIVVLAAVLVCAALAYGWRYFTSVEAHYHALILLFLAGIAGFALTGDLFDMFVFFELMGAVAYALTGFKIEDPGAVQGGLNFGLINSLGAYLTLVGIGLMYARTGQLGLAAMGAALRGHPADPLLLAGFVCVVTGFLVKAALVPFHFWLADAHAVAPTPVCVLFSGIMVPLGLYGTLRVYVTVFGEALPPGAVRRTFLALGVVTAVVGAVMCVAQRNLKRLLAYSTIAHMGLFACAAFLLTPAGLAATAVYAVAHAGVKAGLFLTAGMVLNRYGTVDEHDLHGRVGGVVPVLLLAGGAALTGLPPFGPGLGKALGEDALSAGGYAWGPVLFIGVSALTGGAVLRAALRVGYGAGPRPSRARDPEETGGGEETEGTPLRRVPATMFGAAAVLVAAGLAAGVLPGFAAAAGRAAVRFLDAPGYAAQVLHGVGAGPVAAPEAVHWTATGVVLGLVSAGLAVVVAAVPLVVHPAPVPVRRAVVVVASGFRVLRRVHSGHVGDYVAWLLLGVTVLAAALVPAL